MKWVKRYPMRLLLCLLAALCAGCGQGAPAEENGAAAESAVQAEAPVWAPVTVTASGRGEVCFSLSPQEFIQRYNALFRAEYGEDMLPALDQWMDYGVGALSQSAGAVGHQYVSLMDENNYAEPTLALCVTQDGEGVMEAVTGLSQKNYDDGPEGLFQCKTLYSLRVFFPDLEEEAFGALYDQLFQGGAYAEAGAEALPVRVFYQDGVACYGVLQIGECDEIHVRAADQALLDQWRGAGVEVIEGIVG